MSLAACNHTSIAPAKLFVSTPSPIVCRAVYRPYLIEAKIPQRPCRLVTVPPPAPPSSTPLFRTAIFNALADHLVWFCYTTSSSR
ncbi:hypothetical protein PGT21_029582 [Puccinia graminis f. sp. tritici]|uniref:Uncharacterized protein n=1 Tax=Puccinia graminis f. sp. tritici TaxID=56615 RepID=A0A5B0MGM4_PUCGR|nr:hypothetical protein PGT21_029582 [Puccinia graminis f. sp. tritici]